MEEHYSSEEEEVYFGSLAESEISKRRRFLGSNYNSPVTPRPPRINQASIGIQGGLPDVLGISTPVQSQLPAVIGNDQDTQHNLPSDDSLDDIIVLDASVNSNSVITVSDDESFVNNELVCTNKPSEVEGNYESVLKETPSLNRILVEDLVSNSSENEEENLNESSLHNDESFLKNESVCTNQPSEAEGNYESVLKETPSLNRILVEDLVSNSYVNEEENLNERSLNSDESFLKNESVCTNKPSESEGNYESVLQETASVNRVLDEDIVSNSSVNEENLNESSLHSEKQINSQTESTIFNNGIINSTETDPVEACQGRFSPCKDFCHDSKIAEEKSLNESLPKNLDNHSFFSSLEKNILHKSANECHFKLKSNQESINSSLVQDIDEFIGDSNEPNNSCGIVEQISVNLSPTLQINAETLKLTSINSSKIEGPETPTFVNLLSPKGSSELQNDLKKTEFQTDKGIAKHGRSKHSFEMSDLSIYECTLNGVTDSILNISHGSSLPSPPNIHSGTLNDISNFDESIQKEDLHMSVDEVDFQRQRFSDNFVENSTNISQPSEYKSCPSAYSSFNTAYDKNSGSISEQSNSFHNYRDLPSDLDICPEISILSTNLNDGNADEANASFEKVMQNRQNSFNSTPASETSQSDKDAKKVTSKLPIYQNSKTLLRPPKFIVKPDNLKTSSCKFAKQISKLGIEQKSSNLSKPEVGKTSGLSTLNKHVSSSSKGMKMTEKQRTFTKTPIKIGTPKHTVAASKPSSVTKSKIPSGTPKQTVAASKPSPVTKSQIPSKNCFSVSKTPSQNMANITPAKITLNKTPGLHASGIPRAVKSDSKVSKMTPLRDHNIKDQSAEKCFYSKIKYKNVISPIQAYIKGSQPVFQRKAEISEERESLEGQKSTAKYVSPLKAAPRAVQRLEYENVQGQENVNPNVLDLSRDTIPSKILTPSLEVFWKEGKQSESHLPKMGEKQSKILVGSPKVKVITHEGRVNQSPKSKGILVPNNETPSSTSSEVLDVLNLPSVPSDGRISVRIEKAAELP